MAKGARERKARMRSKRRAQKHVVEYLQAHSCIDCGETDILVLDFDHINPAKKTEDVSRLIHNGCFNKLLKEIAKCEIRCANCHRRRTSIQNGSYRLREINDNDCLHKLPGFEKKLSGKKAQTIRQKYNMKRCTKSELAKMYKVSWMSIHRIINGETWRVK